MFFFYVYITSVLISFPCRKDQFAAFCLLLRASSGSEAGVGAWGPGGGGGGGGGVVTRLI